MMDVRHFTFRRRAADPKPYHHAVVNAGRGAAATKVEITESPNGRTVHVYVNGERVSP